MPDDYDSVSSNRPLRVVRWVVPWIAFVLLVWVIAGYWGSFVRSKNTLAAESQAAAASAATSSTASVTTTVTGLVATARAELQLKSAPATSTAVIATAKKGTTLAIVARKGTWFRLRDASGHLGWVPNDSAYLLVKAAPAPKPKKK